MARIFDVVEYPNEMRDEIVHRFPESGAGDFRIGSQVIVRNPGMGLGVALMQGFGTFSMQVSDAQQFVTQIVGATGVYRTSDIQARLRSMLLSKLQDLLGETTAAKSVPQLIALVEEIGAGVRAKAPHD